MESTMIKPVKAVANIAVRASTMINKDKLVAKTIAMLVPTLTPIKMRVWNAMKVTIKTKTIKQVANHVPLASTIN